MIQRSRGVVWLAVELAAFASLIGLAWWLGAIATAAWLARVERLGIVGPDAETVRSLAHKATLQFTFGVFALAAGRALGWRRGRDPLPIPWLLPAASAACLLGLVLHHATVEVAGGHVLVPTAAGFAQGFLIGCIAAAAVLVAPIDFAELAYRARLPIAIAIVAIFGALAVAGSGPAGSGTRINLGPIQPIEIVKPLAILFLASFLGGRASKLRWQRRRILGLRWPRLELLVPAVMVLLVIFAGLYIIGDLGPVLLLAFVFLAMFYLVSRASGWAALALAIIVGLLAALARWPGLAGGGTVKTRLQMWQDPWTNGLANGHQLGDGLWATAAGGWSGQGLAHAATPIVPAGKTDLILATATEQLGALGLIGYQLLIASIVFGGLYVAARSRTAERVLIAGGVAILVLVQWVVIQAGTLGQLPLTGIVVPFLSTGRSSMVAFLVLVALVARLAVDARARETSVELDELHAGVRGVRVVAAVIVTLSIGLGVRAAVLERHAVSARGIVSRLGDGLLVQRQNPRLVAIAARIRRGAITDRSGAPLAVTVGSKARTYPLGAGMGTLLGVHPTRVLLPPWALERALDHRLRGYGERGDAPRHRDFDPRAADSRLPSPDLRSFAPLLDLAADARARAVTAIDDQVATRSVRLSIDAALQTKVAKALGELRGKHAAAAVVLDVDTGRVLARVQVPDYDPNAPGWQDHVIANDPDYLRRFRGAYGEWPDKTGVHGMFQAGSIAKLFTALAAVRAGIANASFPCTEADAQGPFFTRPRWPKPIHDHSGDRPHGTLGIVEAIAVSCNVYFGQLGLALGRDPLIALRRLGVEVGYSGDRFDPGAAESRQLGSTAFGQGVMVMSPVQAARLVGAIAGGGIYRRCPATMELDLPCTETAVVDDPTSLTPIIAGMRRVMTAGTGMRLTVPAGLRVYGKTGTADVRGFAGEEPFGIARAQVAPPHSWFVAFAEPVTARESSPTVHGRLAVAVVVPRGGTGAAAAGPLAMQILGAAKELGYFAASP